MRHPIANILRGTLTIIIAALFFPFAYSEMQISNPVNGGMPQTTVPLARQNSAEEGRMIRQDKLNTYYTVKVTTINQKKFDSNHDGYLIGRELQRYLKH